VVELEDHRIHLATVGTRMAPEVLDEVLRPSLRALSLSVSLRIDVLLPVGQVVLSPVVRPARSAHVVALSSVLSTPCELVDWL
jgi:hypothetical protein